jgi:hypothetical protein
MLVTKMNRGEEIDSLMEEVKAACSGEDQNLKTVDGKQ